MGLKGPYKDHRGLYRGYKGLWVLVLGCRHSDAS